LALWLFWSACSILTICIWLWSFLVITFFCPFVNAKSIHTCQSITQWFLPSSFLHPFQLSLAGCSMGPFFGWTLCRWQPSVTQPSFAALPLAASIPFGHFIVNFHECSWMPLTGISVQSLAF
jgi:hypothetical protein